MGFKKKFLAGALATLLSTSALAHTNSIGYVGDGNGGINFWYGSWHDNTQFNEAEIKIVKPDGTTSIDAFNLLSQDSPAGLLSGINYFGSDGTQLIPYDINTGGGESYTWQGLNYANLPTGQYTFIYIPLGDPESNLPGSPTMEWVPMDQVIRSLTINLTQNDINGDANANGILDIVEVGVGDATAAAAAPSGPTVVSQGSSQVIGYIAVSGGVIQVVQRTQTHTMWDNMSDGTTANQMTHVTNLPDWTGRVDQVTQLEGLRLGHQFNIVDGVRAGRINHNMSNGYSANTNLLSFGHTRNTDNGLRISGGINMGETTLSGSDSSGSMTTRHFGLEVGKAIDDRDLTIVGSGNIAVSDLSYNRTIGDFNAAGTTSSTDVWGTVRAEKSTGQARPWVGYTVGSRSTDAWDETGDAQVALTNVSRKNDYGYLSVGMNIEAGILDIGLSKSFDDADTAKVSVGIDKNLNERTNLRIGADKTFSEGNQSTKLTANINIKF